MSAPLFATEPQVFNATLIDREDLGNDLSIVRIRPDSGRIPDFIPGQFIKLGLPRAASDLPDARGPLRERNTPRMVRRAYSIASSPRQRHYLEFLVVRVSTGKLTPRLWEIAPGGRLWVEDKTSGQFTLESIPPGKDVVMVATGTGIAPFVSMVRTCHDAPPWRRVIVINGVRYAPDLAYRRELETLARTDPRLHYIPVVSREPEGITWTGCRGRVQQVLDPATYAALTGGALVPDSCHVMLCGNPEMIVSVQQLLEARGFQAHSTTRPGNLHFERYW